jgi:hypothetical protein
MDGGRYMSSGLGSWVDKWTGAPSVEKLRLELWKCLEAHFSTSGTPDSDSVSTSPLSPLKVRKYP